MTTERIKSIGILIVTLIVGVFIGLLVPGFFHKVSGRHGQNKGESGTHKPARKGDWFVHKLNEIVKPDSLQKEKIKPVIAWASSRLDSIEQSANSQASRILDSVKIQLRPIITEAQWSRLEAYDQQAKNKWHRHGRAW